MPFLPISDEQQIALPKAIGVDDIGSTESDVSFNEKLLAAYRIENTVGSFMAKEGGLPDSKVTNPDFSPMDYLTEDEKEDDKFLSNAILADNSDEIEAVRRQWKREQADRAVLEGDLLAQGMAAIADPINLIPIGGAAYKTYRAGSPILHGGLVTAGAAMGSTALTEGGLHYSQLQRTYGESGANIAVAGMLGGVLGMTPGAVKALFDERSIKEIADTLDPEARIARGDNSTTSDGSISAARVMDDINVRGKFAKIATKVLGVDPLSRSITSEAKSVRTTAARLVENPIAMDAPVGRAVETVANMKADGRYFEGLDGHLNQFKEYKKEGGKLSRREFAEQVAKAMRNGSKDKYVQAAADNWRAKVYDPFKNEAISAKLLDEGVEVTTAESYLNRMWSREKVANNITKFNDVVTGWLVRRQPDLDALEARSLAKEIAGRIMSTPDGRLPYDYKMGENASKGSGKTALRGALKKRVFDIDDNLVEDFLENDIELLASRYSKTMSMDTQLVKEFGDVNMTNEIKNIEDEFTSLMDKAGSEKERSKLSKQKDRAIRDIAAMRDRMRGIYNIADSDNPWVRAGRVARDLNYMRLLGGVVAASIPDVARVVMAEGIVKTFRHGIRPLLTNLKTFKASAAEAKAYGIGTDALMGGRAEIIADVADYAQGGTAFERGVRATATKFSSINLMNQWTAGMKQLHAVVAQTRMTDDLIAGKWDERFGQLGIDEGSSSAVAAQLKKYGKKVDGVWIANTKDWDNADLVEMWRSALKKESNRVIITPGQEKPLFMSTEMGKTVGQFKTFMFSATQRILISSIQVQDKHQLQGLMMMVGLGAMSYSFKQWDSGREVSDDPKTFIMEGIDRSGVLGILMEANNTMEKVSGNSFGLRPLIGVSAPSSRYASRSALDSLVGPTFGLAGDIIRVAGSASGDYEWSEADSRAFRRLLPGQNLSFIRRGLDVIEKEINAELGIK